MSGKQNRKKLLRYSFPFDGEGRDEGRKRLDGWQLLA